MIGLENPGPADSSREVVAPSAQSPAWTWLRVVLGALLFAVLLRTLVFEAYRIPSTSMEDTLLVGDFVFVTKLPVGARVFGHRFPAIGSVELGDVIVFNYPPDLDDDIARRTPYIKRLAAMPGDTLSLIDKRLVVNGTEVIGPEASRQFWIIRLNADGGEAALEVQAAADSDEPLQRIAPRMWLLNATRQVAARVDSLGMVESIVPYVRQPNDDSAGFPSAMRYSLDDYGPLVVPRAGLTVPLNEETWPVYRVAIERFEGHSVELSSAGYLIDGVPSTSYTFAQDYYFALGDNRDDSADSRTWGFVPQSHMIGKALLLYFSWDETSRSVRWSRVFRSVGR